MIQFTVDDREYEVEEGLTILQALDALGLLMDEVDIPHYCWHPKLPIDGSCRLCQVEVEGLPKLQIACNTQVNDGMVVRTKTDRVADARRGVMELLLINHPLDCPICDQAGECKLQDYAFDYGVKHARTDLPRRPAKKGYDLGPTITFDQERCILCRRCVRFCREIPKTGELGVFQRGEASLLETFPGQKLDNPYSMNVADICPVGALTTKDFRFKIRVWFLDDVPSVCNQCSNGCNISASRSNNRVYRYVARRNDSVNDTWICDHGRLSYKTLSEGRLIEPQVRQSPAGYTEAIASAAELVSAAKESGGRIVGVASPQLSNEDLYVFRRLLEELDAWPGSFHVLRGEADDLLIQEEKAPNAAGAREIGFVESANGEIGQAAVAIVFGHEITPDAASRAQKLIVIDSHRSALCDRADVALPARSFAEYEGSFTNVARRAQRFQAFLEPTFEAWSPGETLHQIARATKLKGWDGPYDARRVSEELAGQIPAFADATLDRLGAQGVELGE